MQLIGLREGRVRVRHRKPRAVTYTHPPRRGGVPSAGSSLRGPRARACTGRGTLQNAAAQQRADGPGHGFAGRSGR